MQEEKPISDEKLLASLKEENKRLTQINHRLSDEVRDLNIISNISKFLSNSEPKEVGDAIAANMADRIQADKYIVLVRDEINSQLTPLAWHNIPDAKASQTIYHYHKGNLWYQIGTGAPFRTDKKHATYPYNHAFFESVSAELELIYWIPIVIKYSIIGLVGLSKAPQDNLETKFLTNMASQGARALHNAMLYQELEESKGLLARQMKKLNTLVSVGRALTIIDNRNNLLSKILEFAAEIARAEKGSIMLFDEETDELTVKVIRGVGEEIEQKILKGEITTKTFKRGEGIAGKVAETGKAIIVNDVQNSSAGFVQSNTSRVSSILCVPLKVHNEIIGVINITNKINNEFFTEDDMKIIEEVANQAAVAIHNSRLYELAVTDSLTQVFIRRHLFQRLTEELKRAERYNTPVTIIMLDIDLFKSINDTYGHICGDKVLVEITKIMRNAIREIDFIGRYGGEEFCIVLPNTDTAGSKHVARRIHRMLENLDFSWSGKPIRISVSGGIACYPEHTRSFTDLIRFADAALYHSKRTGRNKTSVFQEDYLKES